jgi:hypothetical protein
MRTVKILRRRRRIPDQITNRSAVASWRLVRGFGAEKRGEKKRREPNHWVGSCGAAGGARPGAASLAAPAAGGCGPSPALRPPSAAMSHRRKGGLAGRLPAMPRPPSPFVARSPPRPSPPAPQPARDAAGSAPLAFGLGSAGRAGSSSASPRPGSLSPRAAGCARVSLFAFSASTISRSVPNGIKMSITSFGAPACA